MPWLLWLSPPRTLPLSGCPFHCGGLSQWSCWHANDAGSISISEDTLDGGVNTGTALWVRRWRRAPPLGPWQPPTVPTSLLVPPPSPGSSTLVCADSVCMRDLSLLHPPHTHCTYLHDAGVCCSRRQSHSLVSVLIPSHLRCRPLRSPSAPLSICDTKFCRNFCLFCPPRYARAHPTRTTFTSWVHQPTPVPGTPWRKSQCRHGGQLGTIGSLRVCPKLALTKRHCQEQNIALKLHKH